MHFLRQRQRGTCPGRENKEDKDRACAAMSSGLTRPTESWWPKHGARKKKPGPAAREEPGKKRRRWGRGKPFQNRRRALLQTRKLSQKPPKINPRNNSKVKAGPKSGSVSSTGVDEAVRVEGRREKRRMPRKCLGKATWGQPPSVAVSRGRPPGQWGAERTGLGLPDLFGLGEEAEPLEEADFMDDGFGDLFEPADEPHSHEPGASLEEWLQQQPPVPHS